MANTREIAVFRKLAMRMTSWTVHPIYVIAFSLTVLGCDINPDKLFERNAPEVSKAIELLDAGNAEAAAALLETYLETGSCTEGQLGVSKTARERTNASFDLGLTLFKLGEQFGPRFGQEPGQGDQGTDGKELTPEQEQIAKQRDEQVTCALRLLRAIGVAKGIEIDLAAHAKYLEGNLEFLRGNYREAITAYDEALSLIPGLEKDATLGVLDDSVVHKKVKLDKIGADAAWNRAIALRRFEEQQDAGSDAPQDSQQDSEQDAQKDSQDEQQDAPSDGADGGGGDSGDNDANPDDGQPDSGDDGGNGDDAGNDADSEAPRDNRDYDDDQPDSGEPPTSATSQDERILDMLEGAPTVQLEDAKRNAVRRSTRGMVDK